jgi:hypothetical protein
MKASEQRLVMILLLLVAVFGSGFMSMRMVNWQRALEKKERSLAMRKQETQQLLAESTVWEAKLAWLRTAQPVMSSVNKANSELVKTLAEQAKKHDVTIENNQVQEPVETPHFHQVGETLLVKAEVKALFQWLHELLAPESFYLVSHLTITPLPEEPKKITAQVHVTRLYSLTKAAADHSVNSNSAASTLERRTP